MLILSLLLLPLIGSLILFGFKTKSSKYLAFGISILECILTFYLWSQFNYSDKVQLDVELPWLNVVHANLHFGIDGLALLMLFLTNVLTPIIIYSALKDDRPSHYYALILLMQFGLIGVFTSLNGLLFYLFWEITLIPIWFICGLFGTGENKLKINLKFFIYTFAGSLFMLIGFIFLYNKGYSFDLGVLYNLPLTSKQQNIVFWWFFLAFAIKLPIFPFHTWQPDTYTMAPTQGSMLLSGIMLKMGVFGIIRYLVPLTPLAISGTPGMIVIILSIVGIVYASIIAITQKDIKKLIAYSSIAHVGLISAGIFASVRSSINGGLNIEGLQGAAIQMLAHGVNVVGMFYVADILYKKYGTRDLTKMGGLAKNAPIFATLFMIISVGTMAVPLTNGFIGEFLLLNGIFKFNMWYALIAGLTLILCAVYITRMYGLAMFGKTENITVENQKEISVYQMIGLGVISVLILICGVYPQFILNISHETIKSILYSLN